MIRRVVVCCPPLRASSGKTRSMTAVAPSPLPFTTNARLVNDTASSSQRSYHKSPRRQNGAAASPISMKNFSVGKPVNGSTHQAKTGLDAYGDGIKALLADPIKFELYAKKVSTDETKYKPINPTVDSAEDLNGTDGSAQAGVSQDVSCLDRFMLISAG